MLGPGTVVAGFRIDQPLGEGGMASVYRATQLSLSRSVALKILAAHLQVDRTFRDRFRRECELQAKLKHPNIVEVYESGESEHGLYLAMRLVEGPTLHELLASGPLPPGVALSILTPIAEGLDAAHRRNLVHRDITPQNILIDEEDRPYLADFGISRADGDRRLTRTNEFIATCDYVSPEQVEGLAATARSDIYALSGVLFESLTGRVPFGHKETHAAILYAHAFEQPPKPTEVVGDLPRELDEVLERGLAKDPEARFDSAAELMRAAGAALGLRSAEDLPRGKGGTVASSAPPAAAQTPAPQPGGEVSASSREPGRTRTEARPGPSGRTPGRARRLRPEPQSPPGGEESRRRRPLRTALAVIAPLALVAATFTGSMAVRGEPAAVDLDDQAAAGPLRLRYPDGWERVRGTPVRGLALDDELAVAPAGGDGEVVAGLARAPGPTLLPRRFRRRLDSGELRREPVSLGGFDAYRYESLQPDGEEVRLTVFVAPASRGVATIVCRQPGGSGDVRDQCSRIASTARLVGVAAYPLGPDPALAALVRRRLTALNGERRLSRRRLARADTPDGQARSSAALAAEFEAASKSVSGFETTPESGIAQRELAAALAQAGAGYEALASAVSDQDRPAFRDAKSLVGRAERAVNQALRSFRSLGYRVRR